MSLYRLVITTESTMTIDRNNLLEAEVYADQLLEVLSEGAPRDERTYIEVQVESPLTSGSWATVSK
jgi:hypothetical protein